MRQRAKEETWKCQIPHLGPAKHVPWQYGSRALLGRWQDILPRGKVRDSSFTIKEREALGLASHVSWVSDMMLKETSPTSETSISHANNSTFRGNKKRECLIFWTRGPIPWQWVERKSVFLPTVNIWCPHGLCSSCSQSLPLATCSGLLLPQGPHCHTTGWGGHEGQSRGLAE